MLTRYKHFHGNGIMSMLSMDEAPTAEAPQAPGSAPDAAPPTHPLTEEVLALLAGGEAHDGAAQKILDDLGPDPSAEDAEALYEALRAWTWRALTDRRRDEGLAGWSEALRRAAALLRPVSPAEAERLLGFNDLLVQSAQVAASSAQLSGDPERVLQRQHVPQLLRLLLRRGLMPREELRVSLRLGNQNLARILAMLSAAGLLEREVQGRTALLRLSPLGQRVATRQARLQVAPLPEAGPVPPAPVPPAPVAPASVAPAPVPLALVQPAPHSAVVPSARRQLEPVGASAPYGYRLAPPRREPSVLATAQD